MKHDVSSLHDSGHGGYHRQMPSSTQAGAAIGNASAVHQDNDRTAGGPDPVETMPFPGPFMHYPAPEIVARFGQADGVAAPALLANSAVSSASSAATIMAANADGPGGSTGAVTARADHPAQSSLPEDAKIHSRLLPLVLAARSANLEQFRILVEHEQAGGNVEKNAARLESGMLLCAVGAGNRNAVEQILAQGADVNARDEKSGNTALIRASGNGDLEVVKVLLNCPGVRLDLTGSDGKNALAHASAAGHASIVHALLVAGAYVNFVNPITWRTALMYASANGKLEVVDALLGCPGVRLHLPGNDGKDAFFLAAEVGHVDIVRRLAAAGADVNARDHWTGSTPLIAASTAGKLEVVKALLTLPGIRIDDSGLDGRSALSWASGNGHIDVVEHLIGAGARLAFVDASFRSNVHHAAIAGHANVVECLLKHGTPAVNEMASLLADVRHAVCLMDLFLDQSTPAVSANNPLRAREPRWFDDPDQFFQGLLTVLKQNAGANANAAVSNWLATLGIRHAVIVPMMRSLDDLSEVWRTLAAGGQAGPSDQQVVAYFASTMSRLVVLAPDQQISTPYREARLSPAGLERLSQLAITQRDKLTEFAEAMTAKFASHLLEWLLPDCRAKTRDDLLVDANALRSALIAEGLASPLAKALADSWYAAMQELASTPVTMPQTHSMARMLKFLHQRLASKGTVLFVRNLAAQLDSPSLLAQWSVMLGNCNAEGLFALFDDQCRQLRQYCHQMSSSGSE